MRTDRLTALLERTLEAKAAQASDPDSTTVVAPFDPDRPASTVGLGLGHAARRTADGDRLAPVPDGSVDLNDLHILALSAERSGSTRGRRRRLLVPVAACVVVATALGAGFLQDGDGDGDDEADVAVRPLELGDPPDGWLVPAWLPDGMELWGIDTTLEERPDDSVPDTIPQLFGDPEAGRAIYVTSHRYSMDPATVEDVAVRGTTGSAGTGWGIAEEDLGDAIRWDERGATITALYRGVSEEEAIAVLDSLDWRTDDPLDGFAPPTDDAWPLRAEATSRSTLTRDADLQYSAGVPALDGGMGSGNVLRVSTSTSSAISSGYLETWYLKGSGDGTGPVVTSRNGREVSIYWPDGRSVTAAPDSAESSLTLDALEQIATSTTTASTAGLAALRADTENRVEALPVVATADTAIGTVEVRADQGVVRQCLRRPGSMGADCDTSAMGGGARADGSASAITQWTVDGAWYITVASRGEVPQIFDTDVVELPADTTVIGDWTVQVVQPPPDATEVCVGDEAAMSCIPRPE